MNEGAPGEAELGIGTHPGLLKNPSYLTSFPFKLGHGHLLSVGRLFPILLNDEDPLDLTAKAERFGHAVYCFFSSIVRVVALPAVTVTACSFGPVTDCTATSW